MRLNDDERSVLDKFASSMFATVSLPADVLEAIRAILARDAERTTLVTPEWLDGPEGKRLGFRVPDGAHHWETPVDTTWCQVTRRTGGLVDVTCLTRGHIVQWEIPCNTIAQCRAAVFLATGRE